MTAGKPLTLAVLGANLAFAVPLSLACGAFIAVGSIGYGVAVSAIAAAKVVTR